MSNEHLVSLSIAELVIAEEPVVVTTVLGSCVSVALFSQERRIGGIIHFALPSQEQGDGVSAARMQALGALHFGSTAIPILVDELCKRADLSHYELRAKIIGGASVLDPSSGSPKVGPMNVAVAEKVLAEFGIPIVAREVGGLVGRKLRFYPQTGRLLVAQLDARQVAVDKIQKVEARKRVLIIDDSKTIRLLLAKILSAEPFLEVVGSASDPIEAEPLIKKLRPDVLTLDIHMPRMDGITFLEKLLPKNPLPVVMITAISKDESTHVFRALELGAVDYIQKPSQGDLPTVAPLIREKVLTAAHSAKIRRVRVRQLSRTKVIAANNQSDSSSHSILVAMGASTGGTESLREVLVRLPKEIPPIVIVQHIPPIFSKAFADRLNEVCPFEVKEAENGDAIKRGRVLIAPGGRQMAIEPDRRGFKIRITDDAPVNRHKPSVDHLFDSIAKYAGKKAIGIILTGMGNDGAKGLLRMKQAGARTIAQDEDSSVVYGMPRVAFEVGAVDEVHSLDNIPEVLVKWLNQKWLFRPSSGLG